MTAASCVAHIARDACMVRGEVGQLAKPATDNDLRHTMQLGDLQGPRPASDLKIRGAVRWLVKPATDLPNRRWRNQPLTLSGPTHADYKQCMFNLCNNTNMKTYMIAYES